MDFQYAVELADEHGTVLARCTMRMLDERVGRLIVEDLLGPLPDGEYLLRSGGREIDATVETVARLGADVRVARLHWAFGAR